MFPQVAFGTVFLKDCPIELFAGRVGGHQRINVGNTNIGSRTCRELPQHRSHRFMIFDWLPWTSLHFDNTTPHDLPGKMIANGTTANGGNPEEGKLPPPAEVDHEEEDDAEEEGTAPAAATGELYVSPITTP